MKSVAQKRPRRTNRQIEKDIFDATRQEIISRGFASLTLIGIIRRAKIDPKNFYNRYKDLNELLCTYVDKNDYWNSPIFDSFDKVKTADYPLYMKRVFMAMIEYIVKDRSMQELVLWELAADNDITRSTNRMREERVSHIVDAFHAYFAERGLDIDFRTVSSVLLCAVYFLMIHKGKSTYCGVDFKSRKGQQLLISTVEQMIDRLLFAPQEPAAEVVNVARKMKLSGIDIATICYCTGLKTQLVEELQPKLHGAR